MSGHAASRAFGRACSHGHSGRARMMGGDEYATFPPLPGDRHPSAGHPLQALRPHPRLTARQHQRGSDRALPPGPSRSARHPHPITKPSAQQAGDSTADVRQPRAHLSRPQATGAPAITERDRCFGRYRAKRCSFCIDACLGSSMIGAARMRRLCVLVWPGNCCAARMITAGFDGRQRRSRGHLAL
jgi:hypothetical protein